LEAGQCAVREIPAQRWDPDRFYDPDPGAPGKSNCRWGGFLTDIDAFDPLFFRLSGAEAERMDPQQRLFLEACWTALEDAGYASDTVSGLSCGVFAGASASDYPVDSQRSGAHADAQIMIGNDTAILAARISYLLNLRGPSIALNTACSSSLVALHLACQAIVSGQCEMALAGGVCLFITPGFYVSASKAGMLSPHGLCRTFDRGADGFVPGEGVGVVVLKELAAAQRDGDHIRGVILGVGTNQDGKSNGITAPSSRAQTELQLGVYRQAGINPDSITLVEAHGTGTALGDPIEIEALTRSFAEFTDRRQFCAVGSIKTNIGHTGQAAGVAGVIKCLLAFESEVIPPTLHFEQENPRIGFAETPFFVPTVATPWPRRPGSPRRAAVSSYGYSGTNAHAVIEEPPVRLPASDDGSDRLFLISAQTADALRQRLDDLCDWLADPNAASRCLAEVAFTLHAGRKHFGHRVALVADSRDSLLQELRRRRDEPGRETVGLQPAEKAALAGRLRQDLANEDRAVRRAALHRAADAYERGLNLDVAPLFPDGGRRVPLPTYPFSRERYWDRGPTAAVAAAADGQPPTGVRLEESATDNERRYRFQSDGAEFFVADHVIEGRPVLAAMVSVEMAYTAAVRSGHHITAVSELTWRRPLPAADPAGLEIRLRPVGEDVAFEIGRRGTASWVPGVTGLLRDGAGAGADGERLDLPALRDRLTQVMSGEECYRRFAALGFDYGPSFRTVQELRCSATEVLARLELPACLGEGLGGFVLHPAILDGALQAMIALAADGDAQQRRLPHTLGDLVVHRPLTPSCVAHLVRAEDGLDIRIADDSGQVLVSLRGLTAVASEQRTAVVPAAPGQIGLLRLRPAWSACAAAANSALDEPTLVLDLDDTVAATLRAARPACPVVLGVPGPSFRQLAEDHYVLDVESPTDYAGLLAASAAHPPRRILVLWSARGPAGHIAAEDRTFYRLLALSQALMANRPRDPVQVRVVHPVDGDQPSPDAAAVAAFARSARLEYPDLQVQSIGLPVHEGSGWCREDCWDVLLGPTDPRHTELRVGT
ncbi:MAG: beta-ketoacyl synthase N-terminal-like domain-containing protein, partial [Stackebrandtia sp.]